MNSITRPGWVCRVCATSISRTILRQHQYVGAGGVAIRSFGTSAIRLRVAPKKPSNQALLLKSKQKPGPGEKFTLLKRLILHRFDNLVQSDSARHFLNPSTAGQAGQAGNSMDPAHVKQFKTALSESCDLASAKNITSRTENPLFWTLRTAFVELNLKGLDKEISYSFSKFVFNTKHNDNITPTQLALANFQHPEEWYPATRALQRTVHLHVGPTNSGKTYHALQALRKAKSGIYAGPLRLLAHEVFTRFQADGIPIALVTGEEQRFPDADTYLVACTVEMSPLNQLVDVAVIDEIQMIADDQRGWAWTAAVLGLMAKELHLCGEERTVALIQAICAKTGDKLVIHQYQRLNTLETMPVSLEGKLTKLEKGDAVVSFSRVGLWALKRSIEEKTGRRCAIVYGGLPPETRAQQAAFFNDPDNDYDFITASDAIGMGLNLSIKRVIFESVAKNDGTSFRELTVPEVKQIGGRAGRYRTAGKESAGSGDNKGYVTTLERADLDLIANSFKSEPLQIKSAGIQLPSAVIERFAKYFPDSVPLSFILLRLRDICSTSSQYHLCSVAEATDVADMIQEFPMSVADRLTILAAPVNVRDSNTRAVIRSMACAMTALKGGHLLEIEGLDLDLLEEEGNNSPKFLGMLEALHRGIGLYLWLSYRYPNLFVSQTLAFHTKALLEERINGLLSTMRFDETKRKAFRSKMRAHLSEEKRLAQEILGDGEQEAGAEGAERGVGGGSRRRGAGQETKVKEGSGPPHHEIPGSWNEGGHEEPIMGNQEEADALVVETAATTARCKQGKQYKKREEEQVVVVDPSSLVIDPNAVGGGGGGGGISGDRAATGTTSSP